MKQILLSCFGSSNEISALTSCISCLQLEDSFSNKTNLEEGTIFSGNFQ